MRLRMALGAVVVLVACGGDGDSGAVDAAPPSVDANTCPATGIVFLNGIGEMFTAGPNDATTNTSSILSQNATMAPFPHSQMIWDDALVPCFENALAPYNISVVTTDPGDVDHFEVVLTGSSPSDIGAGNVTSISPGGCGNIARPISFVFVPQIGDIINSCRSGLWTIGTLIGLDFTMECSDTMTYSMAPCDNRMPAYTDASLMCGDTAVRDCLCGGSTQNSHQSMLTRFGPASCKP